MRTMKMQSKQNIDWESIQEVKQAKKEHKQFRQNRQSRKGFWIPAE